MIAAPQIVLDEEAHRYTIDGLRAAGATELIKGGGMMQGPEYADDAALWRGQVVHEMARQFMEGTLDEEAWKREQPEEIVPFLDSIKTFRRDTGFRPLPGQCEKVVGNALLGVCARIDVEGLAHDGRELWLVDYKTAMKSNSIAPWVGLQLALQDIALGAPTVPGFYRRKRYGLKLLPSTNYNLVPFKDADDYAAATGLITVNNWRRKHE